MRTERSWFMEVELKIGGKIDSKTGRPISAGQLLFGAIEWDLKLPERRQHLTTLTDWRSGGYLLLRNTLAKDELPFPRVLLRLQGWSQPYNLAVREVGSSEVRLCCYRAGNELSYRIVDGEVIVPSELLLQQIERGVNIRDRLGRSHVDSSRSQLSTWLGDLKALVSPPALPKLQLH